MLESAMALKQLDTKVFDTLATTTGPQDASPEHITVPDAHLLFNGEFKRVGTTGLKITGEDGKSFFLEDYFSGETRKHLLSPEGAMLSAHVVAALAGPLAPGQTAQAGAQPAQQAVVGRVDAISGSCTVVRNGVTVSLNMGDNVRKGDVVQTSGSSAISIVFTDGSTFSLSANARMVLDEFVYNAAGGNNSAVINLVQGTFSFVAGQVAKTGDMRIDTPVATMGIRGTAVLVEISANDGQTRFSVMVEPNGTTGSFNLYNKTTGALLATVNNSQIGWLVTPAGPLQVVAQQVDKTPAQLQQELGIVQQLFNIFNNYQQNPIDPNQQDPGQRGDIQSPQNAGSVGSGGGPGSNQPSNYTVTITQIPSGNPPQNPQTAPGTPNPTNPNPNTPNPNAAGPDGGSLPPVPLPTGTYHVINGTDGDDTIIGTPVNDIVYAGAGNDLITAGHGGGDDIYDGGTGHDKIEFPSSHANITFELNIRNRTLDGGEVVKESTATGAETGSDIFFRIEEIEGGQGNDTFVLHDTGNWKLDGGDGTDTVRLDGNVSIRDGATTLELSNIENIDLNTTNANVIDLDLQAVIDANQDHVLVVTGNSQDAVNFLNIHHANGHWELVTDFENPDNRQGFNQYRFVRDGEYHSGETLATVYVQEGINTSGFEGPVQDHIIENVSVWVQDSESEGVSIASIIDNLQHASIVSWDWDVEFGSSVLVRVGSSDLYYQVTGDFSFNAGEPLSIKSGNVTGIAIGTMELDEYEIGHFNATHANLDGFDFSAADFFGAIQNPDAPNSAATLTALLSSASYDFWGSDGADILVGSDFRDTLRGGIGDDVLTGNGGPDIFVYNAGSDRITDFTVGSDKIDLTAFNFIHSFVDLLTRAHQIGDDVSITLNGGPEPDRLRLEGVTLSDLSDRDFVFFQPEPLLERGVGEAHNDSSSLSYRVLGPNGASTTFDPDGWGSYQFVSGNVTWTDAQTAALAMGGYLSNITSSGENAFIRQTVTQGNYAWIGATDQGSEGHWVWANGPEAGTMFWLGAGAQSGGAAQGNAFNHWWGAEPNDDNGAGDYAYIDYNAYWTDARNDSGEVNGYVVEFNGQPGADTYVKFGIYGWVTYKVATGELVYTLNDSDSDTQALAGGQTVTESFDLAFLAANNQTITRTATFTIHGANDAPEIELLQGDSAGKTLAEVHAGLMASGTLHAFDVDAGSQLTVSVLGEVEVDGTTDLTQEQLHAFFGATAPGADGKITWTFNSGGEAFSGLQPGQSLYLSYTVQVSDGSSSDDQIVNVTIKNNIAPEANENSYPYSGDEDTLVYLSMDASDQDGNVTGFKFITLPENGTLHEYHSGYMGPALTLQDLVQTQYPSSNGNKSLAFKPNADWNGNTEFEFVAIDDNGAQSNVATRTIVVNPMPEPPVINIANVSIAETWGEFGVMKTLLDLHVTDADTVPGESFHVYASAWSGNLSLVDQSLYEDDPDEGPTSSISFDATLSELDGLQQGIVYTKSEPQPNQVDRVSLQITDAGGNSGVVNFHFSVLGDQAVNFYGNSDDDVMFDTLHNDYFYGGNGRDTFVFSSHMVYEPGLENPETGEWILHGPGADRISDFKQGEDKIALIDLYATWDQLRSHISVLEGDTKIDFSSPFGPNQIITLSNFTGTLTANDFIFRTTLLDA